MPDLIDGVPFGAPIADQACDASWILDEVRARNAEAAIEPHKRRAGVQRIDREVPKRRHPIESLFRPLEEVKRIALRSDKLDRTFEAIIRLAACSIRRR